MKDLKDHLLFHGYSQNIIEAIRDWTYRSMPTMQQSKRLTSRIWAKQQSTILPHVEDAIKALQDEAKWSAYSCAALAMQKECARRLPTIDYLPNGEGYLIDIILPPHIVAMLDGWALGENFYAFLESERNESPKPMMPLEFFPLISAHITRSTQRVRNHFVNLIQSQPQLSWSQSCPDALNLAIVLFKCLEQQSTTYGTPYRVLHRNSFYDTIPYSNGDVDIQKLSTMWSFDDTGSALARKIVLLYGLEPSTCTHDELDDAAGYILCEVCEDMAMHWESARHHWEITHHDKAVDGSSWRRLDPTETAIFDPFWTQSQAILQRDRCTLCIRKCCFRPGAVFWEHIVSAHEDIIRGKDPTSPQYRERDRAWLRSNAIRWPPVA
ncbi:hypothetical protein DL93DRAFT_1184849 [Clavulina sp. PMI_390]|nr:hypothetical protein DL93DRAFT_1184849 [Clavulina sp. PMI_390]